MSYGHPVCFCGHPRTQRRLPKQTFILKVIWKIFSRTSTQSITFARRQFLMLQMRFWSKFMKIMKKSPRPHVWVDKNWLVRFLMPPRTLLESFGPKLHRKNLFGGNPMRRTHYLYHSWNSEMAILMDFQAKMEDFRDFWNSSFPKNGENNAFYSSDYHQISFCGVAWVHSFPTKCVVAS